VQRATSRIPAALSIALRGRRRSDLGRAWPWLPLVFAAGYVAVLLATFRSLVQAIYLNADFASAPNLGELYPRAPAGAEVTLTNFSWYTTLWFEQLTHGLPYHRQIWQVGPWLGSLVGVGLVAWATSRAAGRWAGAMVAVALGCAGPVLIYWQFPGAGHAVTWLHVCILDAFLVLCATRASGLIGGRTATHALVCLLVAAITAVGVASDSLLLLAGVAPFVLAGVSLGWLLRPPAGRSVALTAAVVAVAAVVGSRVVVAIMHAQHIVGTHFDIRFAAFDRIGTNFRLLAESIAYLFNGNFSGMPLNGRGFLTVACTVVVAAAVVVVVRLGRAWWRIHPRSSAALAGPAAAGSQEAARRAHVMFWLVTALLLSLGFVFTSVPADINTTRYVLAVGYALAALVPVVAMSRGSWARALVVAGLCLVVAGSIRGIAARDVQAFAKRFPQAVPGSLLQLARAEHVKYGYAGYLDAVPISWQTKEELQIYPVMPCSGDRLCPRGVHQISSWYVPRPRTPTMLVIDQVPYQTHPPGPPPSLGPARRVAKIRQFTVYIYPYDIASRFGRR
jgi:hypothetical protein